jgi:uncharacterized protein
MFKDSGKLLRIFIEESDKHEGLPLHEWIVKKAKEMNLAGATVLRGVEGFGEHKQVHTATILRLSLNLPIIIEIVDTEEKIETLLEVINPAIKSGLATLENIKMHFYAGS